MVQQQKKEVTYCRIFEHLPGNENSPSVQIFSVSPSGSSVLQLPAWGQGALREQPRGEIQDQTAAQSAPAPRQWGESKQMPSPTTFHASIHPSITSPPSGQYRDKRGSGETTDALKMESVSLMGEIGKCLSLPIKVGYMNKLLPQFVWRD